jgi:alkyl sulfatase BDS1-like metallo-beta-lactamase superfamily hydrolase
LKAPFQTIAQNLKYVDRSEMGLSIVYWEINKGDIQNIIIINSLGKRTDKELTRVLQLTSDNWVDKESINSFYLPVKFQSIYDFYVDAFPSNYLELVVVSGYGSQTERVRTDEEIITELNKSIEKGEFKSAISNLDKIIQRNPLNKQLRETRIYCYQQLNLHEKVCQEINFIKNYLHTTSKYNCK